MNTYNYYIFLTCDGYKFYETKTKKWKFVREVSIELNGIDNIYNVWHVDSKNLEKFEVLKSQNFNKFEYELRKEFGEGIHF